MIELVLRIVKITNSELECQEQKETKDSNYEGLIIRFFSEIHLLNEASFYFSFNTIDGEDYYNVIVETPVIVSHGDCIQTIDELHSYLFFYVKICHRNFFVLLIYLASHPHRYTNNRSVFTH